MSTEQEQQESAEADGVTSQEDENAKMNGKGSNGTRPHHDHHHTVLPPSNNDGSSFDSDLLERFGRWLLSIPRHDVLALQQTSAYTDFCSAFEKLGHAHRALNFNTSTSFLQHLAVDDVVLRVFEFLECTALIRVSKTCSRFRELACRSASQRTLELQQSRQLQSVMKLLRAKEQIDGVPFNNRGLSASHVRVPMLGLSQRVLVQSAGDPEYNGVYYCTGTNGNGFVFTKPRIPPQRVSGSVAVACNPPDNQYLEQETQPDRLLRCMIAKRFSNETILWYMSKEEVSASTGQVTQVFSFWARLMVIGDASADICRYPSQTSVLSRNGDPAWQPLSSTRSTRPPIVELLMD